MSHGGMRNDDVAIHSGDETRFGSAWMMDFNGRPLQAEHYFNGDEKNQKACDVHYRR